MKKRFKKFVAVIATIVMATGTMATGMTSMATDVTTTPEETLELLMNVLKDSSEDRPEDLKLDFNEDGTVNVADAVVLEKKLVDQTEEKIVEKTDWDHDAVFRDPNTGDTYVFYKRYYVPYEHDFQKEYAHQKGSGIIVFKTEKRAPKSSYVQDLSSLDDVKTGKFVFEGEEYDYHVESPAKYDLSVREHLLNLIVHLEDLKMEDIAKYDFDMNGEIDIRDVIYFNKVYSNVPWKWVTSFQGVGDGSFEIELTEAEFWTEMEKIESPENGGTITIEYFV